MKKLKLDREIFLDKLKKVCKFIPSSAAIPAYEDVKIVVTGDKMELLAANGECQVKMFCKVKSSEDVALCLPAELLLKTVSLFIENELVISLKSESKIEIKCGKSKYNITLGNKPENFPSMKLERKHESEIVMAQADLKTGIKLSKKFINDNGSQASVSAQGVNIDCVNEKIVFTGLDGYNLGRVETNPLGIGSWNSNFILPEESASKIASLLGDIGEIVICHSADKMILFTDDSVEKFEIITCAVNSKFPNSEAVFSKKCVDYVTINTNEFKTAIARLKLYSATDTSNRVIMDYDGKEKIVMTSRCDAFDRDGEEEMSVRGVDGIEKPIKKGFTAASILKILSCISSSEIKLHYSEEKNMPVFIHPIEEPGFCFIIGTTSVD